MKTFISAAAGVWLAAAILVSPASAHSQLGTPLKKKYRLRSVSCAACHLKEEREKSIEHLTPFGKDVAKILKGKKVTERIESAKELDREERDKVLDAIEKEYLEALKTLDKMKAANGKLYKDALPAGEIEGAKGR